MTEQTQTPQPQTPTTAGWSAFIHKHWVAFTAFIVAAVLAAAGGIYVFVWVTANLQAVGLVPSTLSLWSMNHVVTFIVHGIFWELVLIGIPAIVGAVIGWQWWRRVPEEEKRQYNLSSKRSRGSRAGGAISPLVFIAFALKVYVDGNWNVAIASWNLDYVVGSMVTILLWVVTIFAIPALVMLVWWLSRGRNKQP